MPRMRLLVKLGASAGMLLALAACECAGERAAPLPVAVEAPAPKEGIPPAKAEVVPPKTEPVPAAAPLPALIVDAEAPLLLEEAPAAAPGDAAAKPRTTADNQACFVCHTNYRDEPLAAVHAAGNVGCMECHGASNEHRNDENNTTPPGKMYPREAIERACAACHDSHDAPARAVIARAVERSLNLQDPGALVCTDCHGAHRLKLRSVRWDKKTGELLR